MAKRITIWRALENRYKDRDGDNDADVERLMCCLHLSNSIAHDSNVQMTEWLSRDNFWSLYNFFYRWPK